MMRGIEQIERLAALLVLLGSGALLAFGVTRMGFGVAAGGGFALLNFYLLRRLAASLLRATHAPKQVALGLIMATKFLVIGAAIFAMIRYLHVDGIGMLVGISLLVLSILIVGFRSATIASAPTSPEHE